MEMPNFEMPTFKMPDFSNFEMPMPNIPQIDTGKLKIVSAIDNLKNINRIRDMDNLSYQIKMKQQQQNISKKRLKSINATLDIKVGRIISILIIIFSIIIPFIIVMLQGFFENYQSAVFIYLMVSFLFSMISMGCYLFSFWNSKN